MSHIYIYHVASCIIFLASALRNVDAEDTQTRTLISVYLLELVQILIGSKNFPHFDCARAAIGATIKSAWCRNSPIARPESCVSR